jgi:hypothetical protein
VAVEPVPVQGLIEEETTSSEPDLENLEFLQQVQNTTKSNSHVNPEVVPTKLVHVPELEEVTPQELIPQRAPIVVPTGTYFHILLSQVSTLIHMNRWTNGVRRSRSEDGLERDIPLDPVKVLLWMALSKDSRRGA